jgi:Ca2+-binding EF-hand superfamily protein
MLTSFEDKEKEEKADSVFRSFDKDEDGFLSKEELKEAF